MTRRQWLRAALVGPFVGVTATPATAAGVHLTGTLTATPMEASEGYFQVGRELALVSHPKSPLYPSLSAMTGREVALSIYEP